MKKTALFPKIEARIRSLDVTTISDDRKAILEPLVQYLSSKIAQKETVRLNFICTHNSRRSHLSQIWARTMAHSFGLSLFECYSGGTEATALFPVVAQTLVNQGFHIAQLSDTQNPVYAIKYSENEHPIIGFSKTYDAPFNPSCGFAAIMTCDSANEACPMVLGAEGRFPITYEDPKAYDNTAQQQEKYLERSMQIATEFYFVFQEVVRRLG